MRLASEQLADLGLTLPPVPKPVAAYVPAVRVADLVFTSGQLPMVDGQLRATGQVGAEVDPERGVRCARVAVLNGLAAVAEVAGGIDMIARVVKMVVFVAGAPGFTGHPQVANGASDVLGEIFGGPVSTPGARSGWPACRWAHRSRSSWSSPSAPSPPSSRSEPRPCRRTPSTCWPGWHPRCRTSWSNGRRRGRPGRCRWGRPRGQRGAAPGDQGPGWRRTCCTGTPGWRSRPRWWCSLAAGSTRRTGRTPTRCGAARCARPRRRPAYAWRRTRCCRGRTG